MNSPDQISTVANYNYFRICNSSFVVWWTVFSCVKQGFTNMGWQINRFVDFANIFAVSGFCRWQIWKFLRIADIANGKFWKLSSWWIYGKLQILWILRIADFANGKNSKFCKRRILQIWQMCMAHIFPTTSYSSKFFKKISHIQT